MKRLLVLLLVAFSAQAAERITHFHSAIRIGADGALEVTERIAVIAEGREIRRGILRDFPTDYRDRYGNAVKVPFTVTDVKRNGHPEPWSVQPYANGARIRIGAADVMLPRGEHVYEIAYRAGRQIGFFGEHDELYWNVNGNGWTFAIDRISAEVQLPGPVPRGELKVEAWTGLAGAQGRNYETFTRDGGVAFRSTRPFQAREGMTILVAFPKGVVAPPRPAQRVRWFFADNRGALAGVAGVALLAAFLFWRWWLVGRDPRAGPKFPRYEPPPGVGAAGVRYVDRMGFDFRCVAAALLGLGSRGYLKIRQSGAGFEVERTGKAVEWLPGEKPLSTALLGPGLPVAFGGGYDPGLQLAVKQAEIEVRQHFGERLFSKNHGSFAAGAAIAVLAFAAMNLFDAPEPFMYAAVAVMVVLLVVFKRLLPAYSVEGRRMQDGIEGLRQYLSVAEKDELARMKAPPQTKEEFAKLLPYAVALDVEKTWADRFTTVLGAAAVSAAVADYYSSDNGGWFSSRGFDGAVSSLGDSISSSATAPGSSSGSSDSGGGGGGSSGGGGGGGGGSGW